MAKLNAYTIMQTKVVNRIITDYWTSKVDVSGTFMDNSTSFRLLTQYDLSQS